MDSSRNTLLQPTLSQDKSIATPFSVQTTFFTAFFGAPLAALAITIINAYRLRRSVRDLPTLLVLLLLAVAVGWLTDGPGAVPKAFAAWLDLHLGDNGDNIVHRFFSLCIVGAGYLLHRREQRNAEVLALERPNGWLVGIPCALLGAIAWTAVVLSIRGL